MSDQIKIESQEAFLGWLDGARRLANDYLLSAGFSEQVIREEMQYPHDVGDIMFGPKLQTPIKIDDAIDAAFSLLQLVEIITKRVSGEETVPLYRLVLDGVLVTDFRARIFRARWRDEDHRLRQRGNAAKPRSPTSTLAEALRTLPDWRAHLPKRVGSQRTIGHLRVKFQRDGRYLITDTKTGKTSKPVQLESISKKFRT